MIEAFTTILPILRVLPLLAFIGVMWVYRCAFFRAWRGNPVPYDVLALPIFFVAFDIAYQRWVFLFNTEIIPPQTILEGVLRVLGVILHLVVAAVLVRAELSLRPHFKPGHD